MGEKSLNQKLELFLKIVLGMNSPINIIIIVATMVCSRLVMIGLVVMYWLIYGSRNFDIAIENITMTILPPTSIVDIN